MLSVERITVRRSDLEEIVLPSLRGTVFHVTPAPAFTAIEADGVIRSNQDGKLDFTYPQSEVSWGRKQGYVCLFDLRDVSEEHLRDALMKFYFLNHAPTKGDPVFLFLDPAEYGKLIPWRVAPRGVMLIPHVETWYPGDVPVNLLPRALAVTVAPDDADSKFRAALRSVSTGDLWSGSYTIEGRTLAELEQRVKEWTRAALKDGLEVEGWDRARVVSDDSGYRLDVRAERREQPRPRFP